MNRASRTVRFAAFAVSAVFATGCSTDAAAPDESTQISTTPPPATSTAPSTNGAASNDAMQALLDAWAGAGRGGMAVALAGNDDELTIAAAGSAGPDGGTIEPESAFRVVSVSKTFVAVMLLQLVADGTLGLDDLVVEHTPELTIADGVTIRQLLAHRSGIPEHSDGELAPAVRDDPSRTWTPADVLALVATSRATSRRTNSSPTRTATTSSPG